MAELKDLPNPASYGVVWFKRDLRSSDHAALYAAAQRGPVLCLYIVEPSLWVAPDAANQHYQFILESLRELYRALRRLGGQLHVVTGEVVDVLDRLHAMPPFRGLYAHEETGNALSFQHDIGPLLSRTRCRLARVSPVWCDSPPEQ